MIDQAPTLAVVEDSDEDFFALRRALRTAAPELLRFPSGEAALSALRGRRTAVWPTLLLLDLSVPGSDGITVLRTLRAEPELHLLPIVVLSGSARREDVHSAYAAGANAYLIKPLEFADLQRALEAMWSFWSAVVVPAPPDLGDLAPSYGLL